MDEMTSTPTSSRVFGRYGPSNREVDARSSPQREYTFDQLVNSGYSRVYRYVFRLCGNASDAADLTQETFLHAFRARPIDKDDLKSFSWLYTIAYRCYLDSRRHAGRRPVTISVDVLRQNGMEFDSAAIAPNPEEVLLSQVLSLPMSAALMALSVQQRLLLKLAFYDELSHLELSKICGCGVTTIRTRLHRIRMVLKKQLAPEGLNSIHSGRMSVALVVGP